jgi:hypothetical protein
VNVGIRGIIMLEIQDARKLIELPCQELDQADEGSGKCQEHAL